MGKRKETESMTRRTAGILGGVFVLLVIALAHRFMGSAIIFLSIGLLISFSLWITNYSKLDRVRRKRVLIIYGAAVALQAVHFLEEYRTGFQREFPGLFGYEWSDSLFATFNLVALGVFFLAWVGLLAGIRLSFLLVWFMTVVGGLGNGIFHIGVSLSRGAYFPGSMTAVVHLVVGVLLLRELINPRATWVASRTVADHGRHSPHDS
jgi:hypothetical protein